MNFIQRFGLRLLGLNNKTVATLVETWQNEKPVYPETHYEILARRLWRVNELMYACTTTKADTASQIRMRVVDKKTGKYLPDHPLQAIIENPNPHLSQKDFWSAIVLFCDLAGAAYFEIEVNNGGMPKYLWPLRPDRVAPVVSATEYISGYQVTMPGYQPVVLDEKTVLHMKLFDPLNQYQGWSPFAVAARVGSVDNSVTDYVKLFFDKGGTPPGLLKTVQRLRDSEIDELRSRWAKRYGGYRNWTEPAILDKDAEYQRVGLTFNEMGFETLDARNESRICSILKVPPILVNAKIGLDRSTYTNYKEARSAWWEDVLVPMYTAFEDMFTQQMAYRFWDGIECKMDFSEVPALREERLVLWQRANEGLRMGGISVNEYRAELGYSDIGEAGEVFLRPLNIVAVPVGQKEGKMEVKAMQSEDEKERLRRRLQSVLQKYLKQQRDEVLKELSDANG